MGINNVFCLSKLILIAFYCLNFHFHCQHEKICIKAIHFPKRYLHNQLNHITCAWHMKLDDIGFACITVRIFFYNCFSHNIFDMYWRKLIYCFTSTNLSTYKGNSHITFWSYCNERRQWCYKYEKEWQKDDVKIKGMPCLLSNNASVLISFSAQRIILVYTCSTSNISDQHQNFKINRLHVVAVMSSIISSISVL